MWMLSASSAFSTGLDVLSGGMEAAPKIAPDISLLFQDSGLSRQALRARGSQSV
jgi:hypothetical protein